MADLILPLHLMPSIDWFLSGVKEGTFRVSVQEPYRKQTERNRYRVAGPNGIQTLSVPVLADSARGSLQEVEIAYAEKWISEHRNAAKAAYGRSPFYEFYDYRLWDAFDARPQHLLDLNRELIVRLHRYLQLQDLPLMWVDQAPNWDEKQASYEPYAQVFEDRHGFQPGLSALDLLSNLGPLSRDWLSAYL
ncbi:MAG: WbqC family protein [Bacteroidia bacterium]